MLLRGSWAYLHAQITCICFRIVGNVVRDNLRRQRQQGIHRLRGIALGAFLVLFGDLTLQMPNILMTPVC